MRLYVQPVVSLEKILQCAMSAFLFLLPWQTIWIIREQALNGVKWEWGTVGWYGTEVFLWFCVFLFIPWYWRKWKLGNLETRKFTLTKDRIFLLFCFLFLAYCFLSVLWAPDREVAWQQAFHILEAVLLFFMLYIGPLPWQKAASWFVVGAVGQSFLGIWQFLTQSTFSSTIFGLTEHISSLPGSIIVQSDTAGRWLRAYGAFAHPNIFGGYLVAALVLSLLFLKDKKNILHTAAVLFLTAGIFFSFSRSAWIAWFFVVVSGLLLDWKNIFLRRTLFSVFVLAVALVFVYNPLVFVRASGESASEVRSVSERLSGFVEAKKIIKQSPWLGVGVGNYTAAVYKIDSARKGWDYQPVHNVPLLALAELGLVSVVLFIGVFLSFIIYLNGRKLLLVPCFLFLMPLAIFDHYLFSSYIGLVLTAVYVALVSRSLYTAFPQSQN